MIETTFALCKPDAFVQKIVGRVLTRIEDEGFRLVRVEQRNLTRAQAEEFYAEHAARPFFEDLVRHMISGPVLAMVLEREDAVVLWRQVMGPADSRKAYYRTLRGFYGDSTGQAIWKNVVHGSDSPEAAARETALFWPMYASYEDPHSPPAQRTECTRCPQWYSAPEACSMIGPCDDPRGHDWRTT